MVVKQAVNLVAIGVLVSALYCVATANGHWGQETNSSSSTNFVSFVGGHEPQKSGSNNLHNNNLDLQRELGMRKKKKKKKEEEEKHPRAKGSKEEETEEKREKYEEEKRKEKKKKPKDVFVDSSKGGSSKGGASAMSGSHKGGGMKGGMMGSMMSKGKHGPKDYWYYKKSDTDCTPIEGTMYYSNKTKGKGKKKKKMKKSKGGKGFAAPSFFCTEAPTESLTSTPTSTPTLGPTAVPTMSPTGSTGSPTVTAGLQASLPLVIPDGGFVEINYGVSTSCIIQDLDVTLGFDHAEVGDLKIWLVTPTGGVVGLLDRPGAVGMMTGFVADLVPEFPLTFDDVSTNDPEQLGANGVTLMPPDTTVFSFGPFEAFPNPEATLTLSDLNGMDAVGTWTIGIADEVTIFEGTLESVDLQFVCA